MKKKVLITVPAVVLLLALYCIIFGFSAQDSTQSGSLSKMITEKCIELINSLVGKRWDEIIIESLVAYFEHPVRKLAHFSEYMVMGILLYIIWAQWISNRRVHHIIVVVWVALSAAFDEAHQYFVPGRYASVADVILDTSGCVFGILLIRIIIYLWEKRKKKLV